MVDAGRLQDGQSVLINGGAGGVGSIAIQIARALGARVAVTCSPRNFDDVTELGAELAIDYLLECHSELFQHEAEAVSNLLAVI